MNVVIVKKKIENRHSYCLRAIISVSRLLNFMSAPKELITTLSASHNAGPELRFLLLLKLNYVKVT